MVDNYSCFKTGRLFIGKKGKYKIGDTVSFYYFYNNKLGYEVDYKITNSSWEDLMLRYDHQYIDKQYTTDKEIEYYFLDRSKSIQGIWVPESQIITNIEAFKILYGVSK